MFTPTLFNIPYILIGCAIGFLVSYTCTIVANKRKKPRYPFIYNLDHVYCFQYIVHLLGGVLQTKYGSIIITQNNNNQSLVLYTGSGDNFGVHIEGGCDIIDRDEDDMIKVFLMNLIICDQPTLFRLKDILPNADSKNAIILVPMADDEELRLYKHYRRYGIWTMENGKLYSRAARCCTISYMDYIYRMIETDKSGLDFVQCNSFPEGPAPKYKEHMPIFMNNIFGRSYDQIKKDEDTNPY